MLHGGPRCISSILANIAIFQLIVLLKLKTSVKDYTQVATLQSESLRLTMASLKLTKEQYLAIRKPLPVRHIACQPRTPDYGVSAYTREKAYASIISKRAK